MPAVHDLSGQATKKNTLFFLDFPYQISFNLTSDGVFFSNISDGGGEGGVNTVVVLKIWAFYSISTWFLYFFFNTKVIIKSYSTIILILNYNYGR